ncbi:hypothetical protein DMN91_008882 [Ooceraea biroi]|uniref:28S ribosomal protein S27, mitochondrial n=1 Tax=Ooceraea biroi TaxID=2015173 RepID=A0A026W027_OOCBI|nr:28S ribosomal protein S27, mitochondrial [Ooceraea biroi]EZA49408.1 28S ribosomal protein S27, mitochondrial [Ooceraea biroi]RLU18525.1 hypothetical protein DMN91_008882 [Ooceraea biroi]
MLKILRLSHRLCQVCHGSRSAVQRRLFLSEAYRCEDAWNRRLETPLLQNLDQMKIFIELEQRYNDVGKASAVDIDIFVNSITDNTYLNEVLKLLYNLRHSPETTNTLKSTHHAVIRYLLQHDCIEELHEVLDDRLNYGIFPDNFDSNLLMDYFIKKQDYASAAKIATLTMLQEDATHPITNALCVYACHKYLENPDDWKKPEEPVDTSKEEKKIRVKYLRNPFFDDHFDLTDPRDRVGKTLSFQGKHRKDALGRTCQLRGLILYKKYEDVTKLVADWLEKMQDNIVYEEVFELISKDNSGLQDQDSEKYQPVAAQLAALKERPNLKDSLIQAMEDVITSTVNEHVEKDISEQHQKYLDWVSVRTSVLEEQKQEVNREKRITVIKKMKNELQRREQLLTFFDKEEQIELRIEKMQERERKEQERVRAIPKSAPKLRAIAAARTKISSDVKSK